MSILNRSLSPKEKQILNIIIRGIKENGYPPTVREIGDTVGFSSTSTVQSYIYTLRAKGYLEKEPLKPRTLRVNALATLE